MNIPERIWKFGAGVLVLLILFLAVLSIKELKSIGYVGHNPDVTNAITVDGTADVVTIPDVAIFSFTVSETAPTVAAAQTKATEKVNSALKAVRAAGIEDKDISTISYNIGPHYEYQEAFCAGSGIPCRPGKSVLNGYEVSQGIQVKVRDLTKAGSIFTSIGSLNVQNVNGLDFSIDNPEKVKAQARALAIEAAQNKAKELAKHLGVSLGKITSFSESSMRPYPQMYANKVMGAGAMDSAAAPAPEVPAGSQKVTSNVSITYEIE
jgi:uncharacterized protein YggE